MTLEFSVKAMLTLIAVVIAIRQGFLKPYGAVLSWPMFAYTGYYRVTLRCDATGRQVSPWDYEPHQDYLQTQGLWELVDFLARERDCVVSGNGLLAGPFGYLRIVVRAGRIQTYLLDGRKVDVVMDEHNVVHG